MPAHLEPDLKARFCIALFRNGLQGNAKLWWASVKDQLQRRSWSDIKEAFVKEHDIVDNNLGPIFEEITNLSQGNAPIDEYLSRI